VVRSEGLLPDLAARLADAGGVVFVDARDGGEPGTVTVERLFPAAGTGDAAAAMSPADLLALVERQHGHAPRAALVTVSGARFELGEGLSEPVADAVPTATRCVLRLADDWAAEAG
jgi:hydrogenase maturation protease